MDESENPIDLAADPEERREMPRCAVDVPATLMILSQGTMLAGRVTEVSLSGCRLLLPRTLSRSAFAAVECTFKIRGVGFRLGGIIERAENNLAAVRFNTMTLRSRDNLMEVLCEVELENNAKLHSEVDPIRELPAGGPASDTRSIEDILAEAAMRKPIESRPGAGAWNPFAGMVLGANERKAPHLLPVALQVSGAFASITRGNAGAVKTVLTPVAATTQEPAPLRSAALTESTALPQKGRDRRASHRCGVDTSATIDLVKVGSKIAGHIVDLSVGGCRIMTVDKFPVGIYTRIETEFQLHGLPFRLGGVIQAIHDRNTVGIRFLDMSQRKKDQVAELVAEMGDGDGSRRTGTPE
jgi:hypothetical protein